MIRNKTSILPNSTANNTMLRIKGNVRNPASVVEAFKTIGKKKIGKYDEVANIPILDPSSTTNDSAKQRQMHKDSASLSKYCAQLQQTFVSKEQLLAQVAKVEKNAPETISTTD